MPYPKDFYYNEKSSEPAYSRTPHGQPDVDRLIRNEAAWKKSHLAVEEKKKTLIFSDWTAQHWSDEKKAQVKNAINKLLDNGFVIYQWQNGKVIPLTKEELSALDCGDKNRKMTLVPPDEIVIAAMNQHSLIKDQVHILDDYWLQYVIEDSDVWRPRILDTSHLNYNSHEDYLNQVLNILRIANPKVEKIIHSQFTAAINAWVQKVRDLREISVENHFTQFTDDDVITSVAELSNKGTLSVEGETITLSEIAQLEKITFYYRRQWCKTPTDGLEHLLVNASKLKSLDLSLTNIRESDFNQALPLSKLETLRLVNFTATIINIKHFLINAINLKSLELIRCTLDNQALPLSKLETLCLASLTATTTDLERFLINAINLKSLDLDLSTLEGSGFNQALPLSKLETLRLVGLTTTIVNLEYLLDNATNLKSLELIRCTLEDGFNQAHPLPKLETLRLENLTASIVNLEHLLSNASNLKSLQLIRCTLEDDFNQILPLPKLETLCLEAGLTTTTVTLEYLLGNTSNLKSLQLNRYALKDGFNPAFSPSKLETLSLFGVPIIIATDLEHLLLASTTTLKSLDLSYCDLQGDFGQQGLELSNLETLTLIGSTISKANLNYLLFKAKNLKSLTLRGHELQSDLNQVELGLSNLETLDLSRTTITANNLEYLLDKATNLKSFTWEGLSLLGHLSKKLKKLLSLMNLYSSSSSTNTSSDSASSSTHAPLADPIHNPQSHLTQEPTADNFQFKYKGKDKSLHQGVVTEQFSQYLTLIRSPDSKFIPKIQDGMCRALCDLFKKRKSPAEFNQFLKEIVVWDGKTYPVDKDLKKHFDEILEHYKKEYVDARPKRQHTYLGENLAAFLLQHESDKYKPPAGVLIFTNPWHAITVNYSTQDKKWYMYDPNFPDGVKTLNRVQLLKHMRESLGRLISVEEKTFLSTLLPISDAGIFIRDGGLLILCQSDHPDLLLKSLLKQGSPFSHDELQGLLLRDTQGCPAWKRGLESHHPRVKAYTQQLLLQFKSEYQDQYADTLATSIAESSGMEKLATAETLITTAIEPPDDAETSEMLASMHEAIHRKKLAAQIERRLETWNKQTPRFQSTEQYCQAIVNGEKKKRLIELISTETVHAMSLTLQRYCKNIHRPFFYVHSPDDLICSAAYVEREGKIGVLKEKPGGPLHQFLITHQDKTNPPVLIVNYDQFDADDIIRFNALLDEIRKADGTLLPECAMVVGLINPSKPNCYQGEDFYSRFGTENVDACTSTTDQLFPCAAIPNRSQDTGEAFPINLCHAQDWKERLLGRWVIKRDQLLFEEGILSEALTSGLPIDIQNGLWDNASFRYFWNQALALGEVSAYGQTFSLHQANIVCSEGYDWKALRKQGRWEKGLPADLLVLNPHLFSDYFNRYECDNHHKQLTMLTGWIATHQDQRLSVNVTRSLNEDEWATLLIECAKHRVILQCHCAPSVTLPPSLTPPDWATEAAPPVPKTTWNYAVTEAPTLMIESTDTDATIAIILAKEEGKPYQVIDISESTSSDLLRRLTAEFKEEALKFEFTESKCALIQALKNGENVILTGQFSPELADKLSPLLLAQQQKKNSEKLILVSSDMSLFQFIPIQEHTVTVNEKKACLSKIFDTDKIHALGEKIESEPLSRLTARLMYPAEAKNQDPWQGLKSLSGRVRLPPFDPKQSTTLANTFIEQRKVAVNAMLEHSPFVYLTGLTGVGKSTFVEKYLASDHTTLYRGEKSMQEWALNHDPNKRKLLFIDEANITSRQWSEFEGLFHHPPGILIEGFYHKLADQHKVIFAGNPLNYGGERKLAPLFERHGNALVFEPLPPELIYEEILKPVFHGTVLQSQALEISAELLKLYQFLCECSQDTVLISPRELQTMALLVLSRYEQSQLTKPDPVLLARYYALLIADPLTPKSHQTKLHQQFSAPPLPKPRDVEPKHFLVTRSRRPPYQQLTDLTALRTYRRHHARNDAQRYGGLGGIVIEGEPGIGKSELVVAHLLAHGYQEATETNASGNVFYKMPVSMQLDEKKKLLLKAFHEGAIVIVDEINSSPMMERLLNDLLMGKTSEGSRPKHPGFMIIGTQNPMQTGRRKPSNALARRLMPIYLPPYPKKEMKEILIKRNIEKSTVDIMVKVYHDKLQQAHHEQRTPAPTFRDLSNTASDYLKSYSQQHHSPVPSPTETNYITPINMKTSMHSMFPSPDNRRSEKPNISEQDKDFLEQSIQAKKNRKY
ncbi:MAG: AAA family ATPase [Gammaproteobacteria bacterium]|nr:AAA family ATPase [Gammaproteobacteria bacterium]MCW5583034.1 AAA family ATPase [Gammaproteobacteria bacterium]